MENVERIEKIILINGIPQKVIMEIDKKENQIIKNHLENIQRMKRTSFNNSGRSTIGKGKKTGNMAKANQARNYKGNKTRQGNKKDNWNKINNSGAENYYSLYLPQF